MDSLAQQYVAKIKEHFPLSAVRLCNPAGEDYRRSRDFEADSTILVQIRRVGNFRGTKDEVLVKIAARAKALATFVEE